MKCKSYLGVLLVLISGSTNAAFIEGTYHCTWENKANNEKIIGTMSLKKTNQTYAMKSNYNDGSAYAGRGIYNTETKTLALIFFNLTDSKDIGISIGDFSKGDHQTQWTWAEAKKTNTEYTRCVKQTL